jgi:uncharacterized protein YecE (DUF72 family)
MRRVRIGCAGWALPAAHKASFPEKGTHLERYARVFSTVEINSSFYRPHRPDTYARWADAVPEEFRFTAKVPKEITHLRRLRDADAPLERFLSEVTRLETKLGALLVQLPASFKFDAGPVKNFLGSLRARHGGQVAWEARHASWFTPEALKALRDFNVAAVAADPAVVETAAHPDGSLDFAYFRLHGSPRLYYSEYPPEYLHALAARLKAFEGPVYCIFDNTAEQAAIPNALETMRALGSE